MKLRTKIEIQAPAETLWAWLIEPEFIAEWNTKLIRAKRLSVEPLGLNTSYRFYYKMAGSEQSCEGTLSTFEPYRQLAWTFKGTQGEKTWSVIESYELNEQPAATEIIRTIDLSDAPVPWWIRPLVWLIITFGKPFDQTSLEKLKRLVEG